MKTTIHARAGERGAVSIKTLLTFILAGAAVFGVIKVVPVYMEQRQVLYDVDELASKSAVRNLKEDDVRKAIETLRQKYDLPENSLKLDAYGQNKAQISVAYVRQLDFIVTSYTWRVDHRSDGSAL